MAEIVTEIAYVPLKPGVDLESGEGKTIWDATLKTVSEQQEFRQLRWGMQIENPRVASLAVEWDSIGAHEKFTSSAVYGPFKERMGLIMDGAPFLFHLKMTTASKGSDISAFDAPVTGCTSLYFDLSHNEAAYDQTLADLTTELNRLPDTGITGLTGGWSVQTHELEGETEKKKLFGVYTGWTDPQKHIDTMQREEVSKIVGKMAEGAVKVKRVHVPFKKYEP